MRRLFAHALATGLLGAGLLVSGTAWAECGAKHSTQSVEITAPDQSLADGSTAQTTKPGN